MIKLSVIVAAYNAGESICKCIDSLVNQTYKHLEIILIDDGSTDDTAFLCDRYAQRHSNVRAFHISNGGVSRARNFGVSKCSGNYVTFVDSDDTVKQDAYEKTLTLLEGGLVDIIQYSFFEISEDGNEMVRHSIDALYSGGIESVKRIFHPQKTISNQVWNKIIKKSICEIVSFDESLRIGEDLKYVVQACMHARRIKLTSFCGYFYFVHEKSVMQSSLLEKRIDDFKVNDWLKNTFAYDEELIKRINTRDAMYCVSLYRLAYKSKIAKQKYGPLIIRRAKTIKSYYPFGKKNVFFFHLLRQSSTFLDMLLRLRYGPGL